MSSAPSCGGCGRPISARTRTGLCQRCYKRIWVREYLAGCRAGGKMRHGPQIRLHDDYDQREHHAETRNPLEDPAWEQAALAPDARACERERIARLIAAVDAGRAA